MRGDKALSDISGSSRRAVQVQETRRLTRLRGSRPAPRAARQTPQLIAARRRPVRQDAQSRQLPRLPPMIAGLVTNLTSRGETEGGRLYLFVYRSEERRVGKECRSRW